jgi:hypothetical protein
MVYDGVSLGKLFLLFQKNVSPFSKVGVSVKNVIFFRDLESMDKTICTLETLRTTYLVM